MGLAVVSDLEAQLGGRGRAAHAQLSRAAAGEIVELRAGELQQHDGVVGIEGEHDAALADGLGGLQLVGHVPGERAQDEGTGALVGHHGDHRAPAV